MESVEDADPARTAQPASAGASFPQAQKSKQGKAAKQDTPSRTTRRGGQAAEMRSSSGECESGESNTQAKASKVQQGVNAVTFKVEGGQGSGSGDDEPGGVSKNDGKADQGSSVPVLRASKPDGKPKLPRPDGHAKCPRCESDDTKFCYYNNYNVKQPRYFCKGCQRYWTAGGTLRNVPVGAGRRKNKTAATREQEKESARAAKRANAAAAGAYEQFRHLLMDPAASAVAQQSMQLNQAAMPMTGFPALGQPFGGVYRSQPLPSTSQRTQVTTGISDSRLTSNSVAALPADSGCNSGGASILSEDGSMDGRRVRMRSDANQRPSNFVDTGGPGTDGLGTMREADSKQPNMAAFQAFRAFQAGGTGGLDPFFNPTMASQSPEWLNMAAAAGQQQAAQQAVAAQQQVYAAQHQLQQAAALQAQAQMQLGCGWGQSQNPYMGSMWPYNMYGATPNWAAAAYASRLGAPAWNPLDGSAVANAASPGVPAGPTTGGNLQMAALGGQTPAPSTMVPISAALVTSGYTWGNGTNWAGNPAAMPAMNAWGNTWGNVTTGGQPCGPESGDNLPASQDDVPQSSQIGNHNPTHLGSHNGANGSGANGSGHGSSMLSGGSGQSTVTAGQLGKRSARSFDT